jgi:hypothetical protein
LEISIIVFIFVQELKIIIMTLDDYKHELQKIEDAHKKARNDLYLKYGLSQALYKPGDIIRQTQTNTTIKVERLGVGIGMDGIPYPRYSGVSLTKQLEPKKNGDIESIYGNEHTEKL